MLDMKVNRVLPSDENVISDYPVGALEAVSKQMREMSQKTIDSIIEPRKS